MINRNPPKSPQRFRSEASDRRTQARIEQYYGKLDLEATWEKAPMAMQCRNHDYVLGLRARIRNIKNYIQHRADPNADL